jgi:hypothetical protein
MIEKIVHRIGIFQAKLFTQNILKKNRLESFASQQQLLNALKEPRDDYDRMILKNRCQIRNYSYYRFFLNIGSFIALPFFIIYALLRKKPVNERQVDLIYFNCINLNEVVPKELNDAFPHSTEIGKYNNFYLSFQDLKLLLWILLKKRPPFWLLFRFSVKISTYRYMIEEYHPKAIAVTNELSPTATAMTQYCNSLKIEHINFMHGEKIFTIDESYNHFDRFYVFDQYYIENFLHLKAYKETKFIIHTPVKFKVDVVKNRISESYVDYTYYLSEFTEHEIKNIRNVLTKMENNGYKIRVRPHPRFTDYSLLKKYIKSSWLESHENMNVEQSISSCKAAISVCSAVLYQCYVNGIPVVIDDVNFFEEYERLRDKNYIILSKQYTLLSEIINNL